MEAFRPRFEITPRMLRQLKAIEEAKGFLRAVRMRGEWAAELRQRSRVQDALSSVQLEGNTLTIEEASSLAAAPNPPAGVSRSGQEFLNYLRAFEAIDGLRDARDYSVGRRELLNIHRILVQGVRGGDRYAGRLRVEDVAVGDRRADGALIVHHQPPHWAEVEAHVDALADWLDRVKGKVSQRQLEAGQEDPWVHPVLVAGVAQHRLVWIHPFVDGNGRSARMFTTLLLYQRGYDFKYLFDLSSYYNRDRDKYYEALRTVDRTGDYTAWLTYFLGGFSRQMVTITKRAIKAAEGLESTGLAPDEAD
jgi:Fic family protein